MTLNNSFDWVQPSVDGYAIGGFEFCRIKQYLSSSGDIFESSQGFHSAEIGPDSDIANVQVAYYDNQAAPTLMSQIGLSPGRPFAGLIPTDNVQKYLPAQRPGRVLVWAGDYFDVDYLPTGINVNQDQLIFEQPVLDMLLYFSKPNALASKRSDKIYLYDSLPFGIDDCYVLIPFYGRRYAHVQVRNKSANSMNVIIDAINFNIDVAGGVSQSSIQTSVAVATTATRNNIITANANGMFDYLQIQVDPGAAPSATLRVVVSDTL